MSIDPNELQPDVNEAIDQALAGFSSEDLAAMANVAPTRAAPDEHGRIHGRIVEIRGGEVLVDIGGKSEAFIALDEFEPDEPPAVGQLHTFMMHGVDADSGQVRLSLRQVRVDADFASLHVGDVLEARVTGVNLGGLELQAKGIRAFMPKSQVELNRVEDFTPYLGRRLECQVTEIDRKGKTVVVSRRRVLEKERETQRQELKYSLAEGQVRHGVVRRLTDFGAFVDLGGLDGLLHVSDISYGRVGRVSDVLKVGQQVEVQVLKIDMVKDRISLGMKQLAADPWNLAPANYPVGKTVDGRVLRLMDFGAFVELEPGVEGLLPLSELSWTQRVRHPKELLKEGDSVRVAIIAIDPEKRKLTLSLKALGADPWHDVAERYQPDHVVSGRVTRLSDFGAFVQLEEGVEGLVHVSEMSDKRVRTPGDVCKPDDVIQVRIKSVDPQQRRISLSMRLSSEPVAAASDHDHAAGHHGQGHDAGHGPRAAGAKTAKPRKKPLKGGLDR
ncbi:MAG: S1 RNA-binding domain-containing protein [Phycisphaerae bacterium]|nr:S1 RNA-binding domain-containing protein [Phycisphaerae bacterium]MCZ2401174.1 S1 RNA-binding domain-containing protein [Phycisphaerae bacterium]NUQ48974.1 S1 RNA-binding domain-containing protein [Phycisphaerae bacterium]